MPAKPEYPVVLRPLSQEDGGGWVAIVPDLPGCMSDGETPSAALQNVQQAVEEWKCAARQMGRPVPNPDDSLHRSLGSAIPDHIRQQAESLARQVTGGQGPVDQAIVHAIIAEWAKVAAGAVRL